MTSVGKIGQHLPKTAKFIFMGETWIYVIDIIYWHILVKFQKNPWDIFLAKSQKPNPEMTSNLPSDENRKKCIYKSGTPVTTLLFSSFEFIDFYCLKKKEEKKNVIFFTMSEMVELGHKHGRTHTHGRTHIPTRAHGLSQVAYTGICKSCYTI